MKSLIMPFLVACLIAFILTPVAIKLAPKFGFMDIPKDSRRMHNKPIPLAGGVAIYIATIVAVLLFSDLNSKIIALIVGSTIIIISGLIDDRKGLSPKKKMLFQLLAGLVLVVGNVRINFFTNPFSFGDSIIFLELLSIPATLFWVVGITNTVNLIDGLDGLAAGVSMICSLSLMGIAYKFGYSNVAIIAAVLAGACLGFLPFNFNPAKIFMGDTGALFLGFVLSYISIEGVMKSAAALTIFVPVLILGVPVFDTAFAMVRRKLSGKSMVQADKGHLHHRLLALGLTQKQTVLVLYTISIIFGILANLVADFNSKVGLVMSILIVIAIILIGVMTGMFRSKEE
ncbi:UDP-GlcNAc:undecaprenyl-phosphate GlcNAc-1-phosphate transferase [Anaerosphaera aminiphila DSM 21120]|uniref:UDP-GlcNAc:undecaprenyl-phosphate GlcNAc-1-phosphate transferase n=1 Tax=Anaerosphaera aminiphila DSM 21120 TaxID=1120995 RepID=A0A1M5V2C3_9FIRM|nr:MraY family glycosyltransferase [Anaerosphaera aminiphila]SHH69437.1 UDP-GlcNAc:undecaprenyl-phosphate GlcNAc-1-phosphate transferase [Anaerosphaera aminiphila DSM 21120]